MNSVPSASAIKKIEVFTRWIGIANPPCASAKLTIANAGNGFVRQLAPSRMSEPLTEGVLARLLCALARPAIPCLDATIFNLPATVIDWHYNSCWTDDYPAHLIRIHCEMGRVVTIESHARHEFMLPLMISDSATGEPYNTFDPELSRALADLMPEGYLERDRLAGRRGILEMDLADAERSERETTTAGEPAAESAQSEHAECEWTSNKLKGDSLPIQAREESVPPAPRVNQAERHSKRLLRRRSLTTLRDLLAQGADPSVADDVGQTALMHAAFPPFNAERFRLLAEAGADLEARRCDGMTGLLIACAGGMADATAEWIAAGANAGARAPDGSTPLMLGATWPRIVLTLLAARAEVNAVDNNGHSALFYAIHRQSPMSADHQLAAIKALLDSGADVSILDGKGVSPLGYAKDLLAAAQLEEEVTLAFRPQAKVMHGSEGNRRKLAEAVVALLIAAGARE